MRGLTFILESFFAEDSNYYMLNKCSCCYIIYLQLNGL